MIRSIANNPAPVPAPTQTTTPNPKPNPNPPGGGGDLNGGQNLAFKGIAINNVPGKLTVNDFVDFLKAGKVAKEIKGGNMRSSLKNNDVFTWNINRKNDIIMGKSKEAEDALYKDLMTRKEAIPGIEIHKIDDWA